jgi:hypothetical protein
MATTGGIHALYIVCQGLLEPGDEVIVPDPEWPPSMGNIKAAHAVPVPCPLHEHLGWRYDLDELRSKVTPKTRAIYINSPQNPTGGVLTRGDVEQIAALCRERDLWLISDESYEDVVFDMCAREPGLVAGHARTDGVLHPARFTPAGFRRGMRCRTMKVLFYTASNIAWSQRWRHRRARGIAGASGVPDGAAGPARPVYGIRSAGGVLSGEPPKGRSRVPPIDFAWRRRDGWPDSIPGRWRSTDLTRSDRLRPGADFGVRAAKAASASASPAIGAIDRRPGVDGELFGSSQFGSSFQLVSSC